MMYSDIVIPSEGDGSTFTLVGHGYYRGIRLAGLHWRAFAFAVDAALVLAAWLLGALLMAGYEAMAVRTTTNHGTIEGIVSFIAEALPWAVLILNAVVMQSRTGQTFGKLLFGMVLVSPKVDPMNVAVAYYALPHPAMVAFRTALHVIDLFLLLGVFSILLSNRRESLADKACNTLVLRPHDLNAITIHEGLIGARDR